MKLVTDLPLRCLFFKHWHIDDTEVGVCVAKAKFKRGTNGQFFADGLPDFNLAECFADDPAWSPLLYDQDIAPGKIGTDVLVDAVAHSPGGVARTDWPVHVIIDARLSYGFRVCGPSLWQKGWKGWSVSAPTAVSEVPLTYALAYGGKAPGEMDDQPDVYEFNPSGQGYANNRRLAVKDPFSAPQIGELAEFMAQDPLLRMTIHGCGPIAKAWLPRRSQAGTFDAEWQQYRHPRMPHDYSLRFWNAAPLPLQLDPPLQGHEVIRVRGTSATQNELSCPLPNVRMLLQLTGGSQGNIDMVLDTVQLDLKSPLPEDHMMTLTWRCRISEPHLYTLGQISAVLHEG